MTLQVFHLGRSGAVAGGMTQVINDFLAWPFPESEHRLIRTRDRGRWGSVAFFPSAWLKVSKASRASDAVVVAHLSQGGSFLREGALLVHARRRGAAAVAHLHGSSFPAFARRHPSLAARVLRHAHAVVVLTEETAAAVSALPGVSAPELIPNAVSASESGERDRLVIFAGAVSRRKGVDTLTAAWRSADLDRDWQLVIAGPPQESELLDELPRGATAVGSVDRSEVRRLLGRARIAVLPSMDEAMPLFVLEALSAGTAVISTPVGALGDVLAEGAGVLVPVGDVDALARTLTRLARDDDERERLAAAGRERWRSLYSPEAIMPRLEATWRRAVELAHR